MTGGGYFFFVMLITPKITTANRLSNIKVSCTVMLSPPFVGGQAVPLLLVYTISYLIRYVKRFSKDFCFALDTIAVVAGAFIVASHDALAGVSAGCRPALVRWANLHIRTVNRHQNVLDYPHYCMVQQ